MRETIYIECSQIFINNLETNPISIQGKIPFLSYIDIDFDEIIINDENLLGSLSDIFDKTVVKFRSELSKETLSKDYPLLEKNFQQVLDAVDFEDKREIINDSISFDELEETILQSLNNDYIGVCFEALDKSISLAILDKDKTLNEENILFHITALIDNKYIY